MKNVNLIATLFFGVAVAFSSCKKDDLPEPIIPTAPSGNVVVTANISENTTWTADRVYQLGGRITVLDGATLTIEPGTIIKGEAGTGANATALVVARGGKLLAEGTANKPIIFTSIADEISIDDINAGNFGSPNLNPDVNGLWGGVLILGKARISASNSNGDLSEVQIEGIPTSDPNGLYGGNNDTDNSGVIKYISIRHGGANIGAGNEINGLTLGGVGSGTVIENVEVIGNQDDGIEWFGGSVNVKNAVVWNAGDDGLDTDQSWSGTVDNWIVITAADHCLELDGPEGSYVASHSMINGTIIGELNGVQANTLINLDANTGVNLSNIGIKNITTGQIINRAECSNIPGGCPFNNVQIVLASGITLEDVFDGATPPAGVSAVGSLSTGANEGVFGWTWSKQAGAF
jgi:hypothetical protein